MPRLSAMLVFFFIFAAIPTSAVHVFDVFRMFQMERANVTFGSQKATVNLLASSYSQNPNTQESNLQQRAVFSFGRLLYWIIRSISR